MVYKTRQSNPTPPPERVASAGGLPLPLLLYILYFYISTDLATRGRAIRQLPTGRWYPIPISDLRFAPPGCGIPCSLSRGHTHAQSGRAAGMRVAASSSVPHLSPPASGCSYSSPKARVPGASARLSERAATCADLPVYLSVVLVELPLFVMPVSISFSLCAASRCVASALSNFRVRSISCNRLLQAVKFAGEGGMPVHGTITRGVPLLPRPPSWDAGWDCPRSTGDGKSG